MINYDQPGLILTTDNISGAAVASGGVIVAGGSVRVAISDIADGASGECYIRGACTIAANNAEAWVDGWPLYWDIGNAQLTGVAGANVLAGFANRPKPAADATASVWLQPCAGSATATTTAAATTTVAPTTTVAATTTAAATTTGG